MTYAEYLRQNGASEEEIKALTEGSFATAAERAFNKSQQEIAAAQKAAADEKAKLDANEKWYVEKVAPEYNSMQNALLVERGDKAKALAVIKAAQERGLIDNAALAGFETAPPTTPTTPAATDTSKFMTRDEIVELANREGEAIAVAQDIAAEHARLFPGQSLNFRELRKEAQSRRVPLEQLWSDRYGVPAARQAAEKAARDAEIAKWKAEGAKEAETRLISQYGNPETRPAVPSTSPFTSRPTVGRDKQPWELNENQLKTDRITRATQRALERTVTH